VNDENDDVNDENDDVNDEDDVNDVMLVVQSSNDVILCWFFPLPLSKKERDKEK